MIFFRHKMKGFLLFGFTMCLASCLYADSIKPDIILIMADDLGFSDLACYGSEISTPNLDQLAREGVRFTQFYNTAKCAPSRASLLSGRYYPEVCFTGTYKNSVTIAEVLKKAGYTTLMTGKWHLTGSPTDQGFDRYFGHLSGATNFFRGDSTFQLDGKPFQVPPTGFYTTDANTDYAIRFIEESVRPETPFFLYIAFNAPHYPLQAKRKDFEKYADTYTVGWDVIRKARYQRQLEDGIVNPKWDLSPRPDEVKPWTQLTSDERKEHALTMAAFAGMVDCLDQNIGRLIAHLKAINRFDNTLFIFLSDNGACPFQRTKEETRERWLQPYDPESYWTYDKGWAHVGNTPFRLFKQNQHEGGISSPLIMHWPSVFNEKGAFRTQPGHIIDIAATIFDAAGAAYPEEWEGREIAPLKGISLLPAATGKPGKSHDSIWQFFRNNRALRMGDWKIVMERTAKEWELYNMAEDRTEMHRLEDSRPDVYSEMVEMYQRIDKNIQENAPPEKAIDGQP